MEGDELTVAELLEIGTEVSLEEVIEGKEIDAEDADDDCETTKPMGDGAEDEELVTGLELLQSASYR